MLDPRECGLKSVAEAQHAPIALVFGRERVGLTNEELQKCHYHVAIAANPEYSSLNLAMAAWLFPRSAYGLALAAQEQNEPVVEHEETPYPLVDDLERFYGHLEQTAAGNRVYPRQPPGPGDEQAAPFVYPRPPGKPGAEHPARHAGVNRAAAEK